MLEGIEVLRAVSLLHADMCPDAVSPCPMKRDGVAPSTRGEGSRSAPPFPVELEPTESIPKGRCRVET